MTMHTKACHCILMHNKNKRQYMTIYDNKLGLSCAKLSTAELATNWLGAS